MIIVDASVLVTVLTDDGADGDVARARLRGELLVAPELIDLEVISVLRRLVRSGALPERRAEQSLTDLLALPMQRAPHAPLLVRCWALRDNFTAYDAAYVVLAETSGSLLLTADARLSRAPGVRCAIEVLQSSGTAGR